MKNWQDIIQRSHEWSHKDDGYKLVTRPSADAADIAKLESTLGFQLPAEFRELYLTYDGFGVSANSNQTYWMFKPLAELPAFIEEIRDWFQETHPESARRYFPIIDWSSGDSSGYFLSLSGDLLPGLYDFEHEDYEFDESQEEDEFLIQSYRTIEDALLPEP
ncbi:MAG: SMI1/KNR4 family protein [Verrucomicrobiales bacterium]